MIPDPKRHPALHHLLSGIVELPGACWECPFGDDAGTAPGAKVAAYRCRLLGEQETMNRTRHYGCGSSDRAKGSSVVWSDSPVCRRGDWQERALAELADEGTMLPVSPVWSGNLVEGDVE